MGGEEGYTLKEVIENNFRDMKANMSQGFGEIKIDMKEVRLTAEQAKSSADAANKRLDFYSKSLWILWTAVAAGIVKMGFDYITAS